MHGFALSIAFTLTCATCATAQDAEREAARHLALGALELASGRTAEAISSFEAALQADPSSRAATLDLAIARLAAGDLGEAFELATQVASATDVAAAATYVQGCVQMRRGNWSQAAQTLERVRAAKPFVAAVHFQLGWIAERIGQTDEAAARYQEAVRLDRKHGAASYRLGLALTDLGMPEQAAAARSEHRRLLATRAPASAWELPTRATYEACELLRPRVPFLVVPPPAIGIEVTFAPASTFTQGPGAALAAAASQLAAPICGLDASGDGDQDLVAAGADGRLRLFTNRNGDLRPTELPGGGAGSAQVLVGDVDNDGIEDIVALGATGCRLWRLDAKGDPSDATTSSGLGDVTAQCGILVDLDHTGTIDLLIRDGGRLQLLRNRGAGVFAPGESWSLPEVAASPGASSLSLADLSGDDLVEVLVAGTGGPPLSLAALRERKARFGPSAMPWDSATLLAWDDVDGDLRGDVVALDGTLLASWTRGAPPRPIADDIGAATGLQLFDHDNDGWLDVMVTGAGLRLWRNLGGGDFVEVTDAVGLTTAGLGAVEQALPLDLDADGDLDLVVAIAGRGLVLLENQGGSANPSLSVRLRGTRSNASGIGARIELHAHGLRTCRMVSQLPAHIGLGGHAEGLILNVVWLDQTFQLASIEPTPGAVIEIVEPYVETGSCPYLFAWNGERFRFVTDLLGVAPLGLPLNESMLVPADADELVLIGGAGDLRPRDGRYELRVTEELREVLYLDQVELVVADHPAGVEVHSTDKLRPPPFPPSELVPLHRRRELLAATGDDGEDVMALLADIDGRRVAPPLLLGPHLRGLAHTWSITLTPENLDTEEALVLALTGWLRYGGATGNVAAGSFPGMAPPTPTLLVQCDGDETWRPLPVVVGLPAGKTKTILVELAGVLPAGARRLRLSTGFEVYWDRIALFERYAGDGLRVTRVSPATAELRWHGHGAIEPAPRDAPVTSSYERLRGVPPWRWTPAGKFTRYGDVTPLLTAADDRLALLAGGDEVALTFAQDLLPPLPGGHERTFYFYSVGWDKDADSHCVEGLSVEPLPFHGMSDQLYGRQERPAHLPGAWIDRYNTRAVPATVPGSRVDGLQQSWQSR